MGVSGGRWCKTVYDIYRMEEHLTKLFDYLGFCRVDLHIQILLACR